MTTTNSLSDSDPFASNSDFTPDDGNFLEEGATLPVGRDASLTLATDALIVLDGELDKRETSNCCGLLPSRVSTTQAIPFFNILWAELSDFDISIQYAKAFPKDVVRVNTIHYIVEKPKQNRAQAWVDSLLDRAYGESQRQKRMKVLINPFGGKGSAQKWFIRDIDPIFAAARCHIDVERTLYQGHAIKIAEKIDTDAYDVVACCSGDGLPHEVFNGLGKKADAVSALSKLAVVQLPCGTGNAMSLNLNGTDSCSLAALCIVKGLRTPLDLMSITQKDRRTLSFLSQSIGMVAEVDLGTEHLRWLGSMRFTYGFLVRLLKKTIWPCEVHVALEVPTKSLIKDVYRREINNHDPIDMRRGYHEAGTIAASQSSIPVTVGLPSLNYGTIQSPLPSSFTPIPGSRMGTFYAGNMGLMAPGANFFPATLPSDGNIDIVAIDGDCSRLDALKFFLAVEKGSFFDMPLVSYLKISGYRITPKNQPNGGYISIDGERVPFEEFQAEVHRGLGTVLSRSGHMYEAAGVVPKTAGGIAVARQSNVGARSSADGTTGAPS